MKIEFEIDLDYYTEISEEIYDKLLKHNNRIRKCGYLCIGHFIFDLYLLFENQTDSGFIDGISESTHLSDAYFIIDKSQDNDKYYVTKSRYRFSKISGFETFEEWMEGLSKCDVIKFDLNAKQIESLKKFILTHKKELGL